MDPADFRGWRQAYAPPSGYVYTGSTPPPPSTTTGYYGPSPPAHAAYQTLPPVYYPPGLLAKKTDEMAIISLICGLASFVIIPLLPAIAAIILGFVSRDRIRRSQGALEGQGLAVTGIILGIANLVFILAMVAIVLIALSLPQSTITLGLGY